MASFKKYLHESSIPELSEEYLNYERLHGSLESFDANEFDTVLEEELRKVNKFYLDRISTLEVTYEETDRLRQFLVQNTVGFFLILNERNQHAAALDLATIDSKERLANYEFFEAAELAKHFENIRVSPTQEQNTFSALKQFAGCYPEFKEYNELPFCSEEFAEEFERWRKENEVRLEKASWKVRGLRLVSLLAALWFFWLGLSMLGNSFKALRGTSISSLIQSFNNPIAGLMVGILVTVLLQSSSTSTSIVVSMVGADILTVTSAIPMIMGANIGTSVTNTIVSMGHLNKSAECKRAFAGATVHDMFNILSVLTLLPLDCIFIGLGWPFLFNLSSAVTNLFDNMEGGEFTSPIAFIVTPVSKAFLKIDKKVIKAHVLGCQPCTPSVVSNVTEWCASINRKECVEKGVFEQNLLDSNVLKGGFFAEFGGGCLALVVSLFVLCSALVFLVKILQKIVLGSGKRGCLLTTIQNSFSMSPYISMAFGVLLTILVQSSSITTSSFTPLVGLGIITLEQMLPLTLGANIGTTVSGKEKWKKQKEHFFLSISPRSISPR